MTRFRDASPDEVWADNKGNDWRTMSDAEGSFSERPCVGAGGVVGYFSEEGVLVLLNGERRDFGIRLERRIS